MTISALNYVGMLRTPEIFIYWHVISNLTYLGLKMIKANIINELAYYLYYN